MPAPMSKKLAMNDQSVLAMGAEALTSGKVTMEEIQQAGVTLAKDPSWIQKHLESQNKKVDPYTLKPNSVEAKGPRESEPQKKDTQTSKNSSEKKATSTRSTYLEEPELESITDSIRNMPEIQQQQRGIADMEQMLSMQEAQKGGNSDYWVRPLVAMADSINPGSKLMSGFQPTGTQGDRNTQMYKTMGELAKRKQDLSDTILGGVGKLKSGSDSSSQNSAMMQQLALMTGMNLGGRGSGGSGGVGETAVDKAFAKKYIDFVTEDYPAFQQNISTMDDLVNELNTKENLTGPRVGLVPKFAKDILMEDSADLQDRYEKIVAESLKRVLGAQFTEQEAKRLFSRSFNPRLSQATNAKRIRSVQAELQQAAEAKAAASRYYEQNGFSLRGYPGTTRISIGGKTYDLGGEFGLRKGEAGQSAAPKGEMTPEQRRARIAELKAKRGG